MVSCICSQDHLRQWIRGNVSECERSLFIFDEMDKMPLTLIDVIKAYIDHHREIDGINYRKSTFIFLRY
jgi:torsin-1